MADEINFRNTEGGANVERDANVGKDFIGRDQINNSVAQDLVQGDKIVNIYVEPDSNQKHTTFFGKLSPRNRLYISGLAIIISISVGLWLLYPSSPIDCRTPPFENDRIRNITSHQEQGMIRWWVAQDGKGLRTFTCSIDNCSTKESFINVETLLASELVLAISWDQTQKEPTVIWVSTSKGVLAKLAKHNNRWKVVSTYQQKYCPANAIVVQKDKLFLGPQDAYLANLYIFEQEKDWRTSNSLILPDYERLQVTSLISDVDEETLWVATSTGLYKFSGGQSSQSIYPHWADKDYWIVKTIAQDEFGRVWVGTSNDGLLLLNSITNEWVSLNGLPSKSITALSLSTFGKEALVGTNSGLGVCRWDQVTSPVQCTISAKGNQYIDSVNLGANGTVLIGNAGNIEPITGLVAIMK